MLFAYEKHGSSNCVSSTSIMYISTEVSKNVSETNIVEME